MIFPLVRLRADRLAAGEASMQQAEDCDRTQPSKRRILPAWI